MQVNPINVNYQNNSQWAKANLSKGRKALNYAILGTSAGYLKYFLPKESDNFFLAEKILSLFQRTI